MSLFSPPPVTTTVIELDEKKPDRKEPFYLEKVWRDWLYAFVSLVQSAVQFLVKVVLENQNASIGATSLPLTDVTAGVYQISWYARITTVDPVSSSLTVNVFWTEGGLALSLSGPAVTGNLTTTVQSGVFDVQLDAQSAVSYSTVYASNTPGTMRYSLRVSVVRKS